LRPRTTLQVSLPRSSSTALFAPSSDHAHMRTQYVRIARYNGFTATRDQRLHDLHSGRNRWLTHCG
jgi:hypothetical protein